MSENVRDTAEEIAAECLGARVRMLNRLVSRVYDDALRPHGLRFSQMNILTLVALRGPVQPAEVGRILAIEKSTLSRNMRLLEDNGWIKSEPAAEGNSLRLTLTRAGARLYKKAAPSWRQAQEKLTALLGKTTTAAIHNAVSRAKDDAVE